MARKRKRLTDYDKAVRALSKGDEAVEKFCLSGKNEKICNERIDLIEKLQYYRDFRNLEEYHANYLEIQSKQRGIIPFKWKPAQQTLYNQYVYPKLSNNEPVRIYILKARQIGFSTQIEGIGSSLCNLFSDIRGTVIAHDKDTSAKIFRMCKLFHKRLPEDFKPARKLSNRYELQFANPIESDELGLESTFTVNTANNLHVGAGTTLNFVHLSEFARYEEVNSDAETALITLMQTVPRQGQTFIFIETTAYGEGIGKRFWDDDSNGFEKLFVSWIADEDYTDPDPLLSDKLYHRGEDKYGNEVRAREQVIDELKVWYPEYSEDEEWLKHESLCRLNWRRKYIDEQCFGKIDLFHQEYPLTADQAFRISGRCVFNTYILNTRKEQLNSTKQEVQRFNFVPDINKSTPVGWFKKDELGDLKIFNPPRNDAYYWGGVDIGAGFRDSDPSVVQVLDQDYQQCAIYRSRIDPDMLAYVVACLGKWYNRARIVPEANAQGIATINKLVKEINYGNVYIRKKINRVGGGISNEWGFYTSAKTRPMLINLLRDKISSGILKLFDKETIDELLNFVYLMKNNKIRMEASPGMHDDRVMALGMAILDIKNLDQILEQEGPPVGSIEWEAQQMDLRESSSNLSSSFGSVTGL